MKFSKFILIIIVWLNNGLVIALSFTVTTKIRLDVVRQTSVEKHSIGSIVLGLFGNRAPKTVANFRHLCSPGVNGATYKGSEFHRIIKHFLIHGGDIIHGNGSGSISIYGKYFDDELFDIQHNRPGYVGMANHGPNTNGCQFYITTTAAQWLNGKHTVFGKVLEGMDTVNIIELVKTDRDDYPLETIRISNCSEISNEPFELYPDDFNVWGWMKSAGIPVGSSFIVLMILHYFYQQLNLYC